MILTCSTDLKTLRLNKNVTQCELAQRLGTQQPLISRIESGKAVPSLNFAISYLNALGYEVKVDE